jgi:hypothetical protein
MLRPLLDVPFQVQKSDVPNQSCTSIPQHTEPDRRKTVHGVSKFPDRERVAYPQLWQRDDEF